MKPVVLGGLMGAMMIWMVHGQMTGTSALAGWALGAFIGVHVVLIAAAIGAGLFAACLSPNLRVRLSRLHRPSVHHIALMLVGMVGSVAVVHVYMHGGIA